MIRLNCDRDRLQGRLMFDYPLDRLNTWRVGGNADCFFEPENAEDLAFFLAQCGNQQPILCLGLGSNVLVRDGGVRGCVITLRKGFRQITRLSEHIVRAEAGVACSRLARYCAGQHLDGLVFMACIPGTVGGALKMNAGAFGGSTWEYVCAVETVDSYGQRRRHAAADFVAGYRSVGMPRGHWFTAVEFELPAGDADMRSRMDAQLRQRQQTQPVGELNCGSVFKNPGKHYAAKLIERCGLRGYAIGDAAVSEKHANFIINRGNASAHDIESLICFVKETVVRESGIRLEPEVIIVGEKQ